MADGSKPKAGNSGRSWRGDPTLLEMQQSLVASIKTKQYTEALSKADQMLTTDPHSSLIQDLRRTLAEKVDLDEMADNENQTGSDNESSDSASGLEEDSESKEQDSIDSTSTSGSDSEATLAAEEVCDVLHVSPEDHAMSAVQRKQMSTALKEQLEDLKIQDASKHMQLLGLSIG